MIRARGPNHSGRPRVRELLYQVVPHPSRRPARGSFSRFFSLSFSRITDRSPETGRIDFSLSFSSVDHSLLCIRAYPRHTVMNSRIVSLLLARSCDRFRLRDTRSNGSFPHWPFRRKHRTRASSARVCEPDPNWSRVAAARKSQRATILDRVIYV